MEQRRIWLSVYGVSIYAWTKYTFERIAAIGGSVICVEEETLDPTSFERGCVLIESPSLTRVEFKVDLKGFDVVFPVRVSEAELFLRGPRVSRVAQGNRSDGSNSDSEDMMANSAASDVGNGSGQDRTVLWWGNQLWDTVGEGVESDAQVTKKEAVSALHDSGGLNLELGGPVVPYKGTAADVIMYRGSRRKVRLLNDVIRSVQSPAEVLANAKRKGKGRGRHRKEGEVSVRRIAPNSPSVITDTSITDSDVNCPQSAILREAKATIAVYAPCVCSERRDLWERLLAIASAVEIPCCLGGDFNEVTNYVECRGCVGDQGGMLEFVGFIHDGGFVDMPPAGKVFTWYGSKAKGCRLDRFLVSTDWLDQFEGLEQCNLLRNVSDHDPVRLSCGVVNWGPRPFRFLNAWLERKGHIKVMGDEWRRISESHMTSSVVDRLRELKVFLKQWNRDSFGCVETQIETTPALLNDLDDWVNELDDENIFLRRK
ncbi:hypothetical protein V6N11_051807 [Hibiscus sabdariffa]|uniref:Endonuclease/exonuclease/phosphatase domain-containing protein n=1 Tax=Hibiscus sabdariffa TaxID=183260 RepID=A0ABR2U902_9ROSI